MGWAVGYDPNWKRDIGYGVPAKCDHPECDADIDRGLAYVCGGDVYGGDHGCGLFFCADHLMYVLAEGGGSPQLCDPCAEAWESENDDGGGRFEAKPDVEEWLRHKLTDPSWAPWRAEHPYHVAAIREALDGTGTAA